MEAAEKLAESTTYPVNEKPQDCVTVDDVMKRLGLNQVSAYQLLAAMRELAVLEMGPAIKEYREDGKMKTGTGKKSYRIPADALTRLEGVLERLRG
jgi:hypothetical protein